VGEAKPVPLTSEVRIDRDEAYRLLNQIRTTLPPEFERARSMAREDDRRERFESQLRQIGASIAELRRAQRSQTQRHSGTPRTPAEAEQVREIIEAAKVTASRLEAESRLQGAGGKGGGPVRTASRTREVRADPAREP